MESLAGLIQWITKIWMLAIVARVILSWVAPDPRNQINQILAKMTDPILNPIQRILPSMAGLDFSPVIALFGLRFIGNVVPQFLLNLG